MCVENIFSNLAKFFWGSYRNNRAITAGQLKRPEAKDNMTHHNEGFKFPKVLRSSPSSFRKSQKDIFAMIKQPALFCCFSSAETQWIGSST